jgi:3'-phosphoadenosine 5'-phosphosulfate sulfotransferase (PAPS reductase)/FAD synthetase
MGGVVGEIAEEYQGAAISFGAGVNSVAMVIMLVEDGWTGPIVFADPGAEEPDTYCYLEYFQREYLGPKGMEITRLSPKTHPDLYLPSYRMTLLEKCKVKGIVPLMLNRWCTAEYKRTPLSRWQKAHGVETALLGIAWDERRRAKAVVRGGVAVEYPLVDYEIGRPGCKDIIQSVGLAVPVKSGCWFCPFQSISDWRRLYELRRDLWDRAEEMDETALAKMRSRRANPFPGQLAYKHGMTLKQMREAWEAQMELPLMPAREYEHQMCECRL